MLQNDLNKIKEYFTGFALPSIKNLLLIVEAIIISRTTNLNIIKDYVASLLGNKADPSSNYVRLVRFFKHPRIEGLTQQILGLCQDILPVGRVRWIAIDRTSWQYGKKNINLLVLSCIYNNVSVPIIWKQLNKRGNSNYKDRKWLFEKAIALCRLKSSMLLPTGNL